MKIKKKSKAFTLTELLVVVVVIGVLSAVVLPKFSKVIETRRTTEAEELMASVRTEQEKRCALDKNYLTDLSKMQDVVKSGNTKNYTLELASTGINASRKNTYEYTLQMPSYADGRICCSGKDCDRLNKNYPKCDDLTNKSKTPDYQDSPTSCAGEVATPPSISCTGSSSQSCGCQKKGTQTRTCDTTTGTWSAWGSCSISDACECTGPAPDSSQPCNGCGEQTREVTCNTATGAWKTGNWSTCSKTEAECKPEPDTECTDGTVRGEATCNICGTRATEQCVGGKWTTFEGECSKTVEACLATCTEGDTREVNYRFECQYQIKKQECRGGQWVDKEEGELLWNSGAECVTGESSTTGGNRCPASSSTCFNTGSSDDLTQSGLNENGGSSSPKHCDSGRICKNCKWVKVLCDGSNVAGSSGSGGGGCAYTQMQIRRNNPDLWGEHEADVVRVICVIGGDRCCHQYSIDRECQLIAAGQTVCYESNW